MARLAKKYRERLLRLARLLERDARNPKGIQFDMGGWGVVDVAEPLSCGTQACAMGLAALSGEFKQEGLSAHLVGASCSGLHFLHFRWNRKTTNDGFLVGRLLFGLTPLESELFFSPAGSAGASTGARAERSLARRIRRFVAARA